MNSGLLRFLGFIAAGALLGGLLGTVGQCTSGTCPLTSTWWRGALYGATMGFVLALGTRSS